MTTYDRNKYLKNRERIKRYCRENRERIALRNKEWAKRNPEKIHAYNQRAYMKMKSEGYYVAPKFRKSKKDYKLKDRYGLLEADLLEMGNRQDGKCAICGKRFCETLRPGVDHNHTTGKNRGLLCVRCNTGLGMFQEDVDILLNAVDYIRKWERM